MNAIESQAPGAFWTKYYGAHRWSDSFACFMRPGTWYLISLTTAWDHFRGVPVDRVMATCVVDDFGNLVRVEG